MDPGNDLQEQDEEEEELIISIHHEKSSRNNSLSRSRTNTAAKSGRSTGHDKPDDETNLRLEDKISYHHLQQLEEIYDTLEVEDEDEPPSLNQEDFIQTISEVIGTTRYNEDLAKLFSKLDNSGDGNVDFQELLTYLLMQLRENDFMRQRKDYLFTSQPRIKHLQQNHLIATICLLMSENPLRYYALSKEGVLCVIDGNLQVEQSTDLNAFGEDDRKINFGGGGKMARRYRSWMCDAVYMANVRKLAVAGHQLYLVDCSAPACYVETVVHGLPCAPFALEYWWSPGSGLSNPHGSAMLFVGGDNGSIYTFNFHKPQQELFSHIFSTTAGTSDKKINYADLFDGPHTNHCTVQIAPNIHNDTILRIRYCQERDLIFSCSRSSTNSLVIRDRHEKKSPYIFKAPKGVSVFDYDLGMEVVVTGSSDYIVRLWNMYVTQRPIAVLEGHGSPITDVLLYTNGGSLLSYAEEERVIKVWDVVDHMLTESATVPFPAESARKGGDIPSRGLVMRVRGEDCKLLATKGDYLALFTLGAMNARSLSNEKPTTHTWPITCLAYNEKANHIAFGGKDSNVVVFEIETGAKVGALSSVHEKEEITCMSFDYSYKRLVTGARNGEVKIWAYQTGQLLTTLAPIGEAEVTGILPMADLRKIFTVGWDRKIVIYDDYDIDATYVEGTDKWQGGQPHEDDISALELCPPTWIATGDCEGQIYVWNYQTQRQFLKLRPVNMTTGKLMSTGVAQPVAVGKPQGSRSVTMTDGSSSCRRQSTVPTRHQIKVAAPIEKLYFLKERYKRTKDAAVLISSEDGILYWWSLWTQQHLFCYFSAVSYPEDYIIAMQSDPDDKLLVCGDTDGDIVIWNIGDYALQGTGEVANLAPSRLNSWKAHTKTISSIHVFPMRSKLFIASASYDRNVRLWSLDGQLVGTFCADVTWDLRDKSTWQAQEDFDRGSPLFEDGAELTPLPEVETAVIESKRSSKVGFKDVDGAPGSPAKVGPTSRRGTASGRRSTTLPQAKMNLGTRVKENLSNIKKNRENRRTFMGDIEREKMRKYGTGASAFQALVVADVGDTELPQGLPLLPGMKQRGITNMTEETLRRINFTKTSYITSMFET